MLIILKNITETTGKQDIEKFIAPALKGGLFSRNGQINNISILVYKDNKLNIRIFHGLVDISPDSMAAKAVKKLNRKAINGKRIAVNQYYIRNWRNDRRLRKPQAGRLVRDLRVCDRRNQNLEMEVTNETFKFSSNQAFNRKLF